MPWLRGIQEVMLYAGRWRMLDPYDSDVRYVLYLI